MTHDDLLNIYFPKVSPGIPDYVPQAQAMPPQQPLPDFMTQQTAPPSASVGQGGGGGGGDNGMSLMKLIPTLISIFGL